MFVPWPEMLLQIDEKYTMIKRRFIPILFHILAIRFLLKASDMTRMTD